MVFRHCLSIRKNQTHMVGILEWSYKDLKPVMNDMLNALVEKVGSVWEQMSNVKREIEILRRVQKKC
jgi:hypothetical protein